MHGLPLRDAPGWLGLLALVLGARRAARPRLPPRRRARGGARRARRRPSAYALARAGRVRPRDWSCSSAPRRCVALAVATLGAVPGQLRWPSARAPPRMAAATTTRLEERGARAHGRAARDPARDRPAPRPGGRVARRRDRRAHRAHQPAVRAPRAGRRAGAGRGRAARATPRCCTTSARSASPTASCSSPARSTPTSAR